MALNHVVFVNVNDIKIISRMPKLSEALDNIESSPKNRSAKLKDTQEQRRKQQVYSRMQVLLFRHKELLKKDILKKRALLEKELQIDIQVMLIINI